MFLTQSRVSPTPSSSLFNPFSTSLQSYSLKRRFDHIATLTKNEWIASIFKIKCANLSMEYRVLLGCPQSLLDSPRLSFSMKHLFPAHSRPSLWLFMHTFHLHPILFLSLVKPYSSFYTYFKECLAWEPSLASPELFPPPGMPSMHAC